MNNNNEKFSVNIDKLNIDWNAQKIEINKRISEKQNPQNRLYWLTSISTITIAILILIIHSYFMAPKLESEDYAYMNVDEIVEVEIPDSLYVMNGFSSSDYDFDDTADYILAEEGDSQ